MDLTINKNNQTNLPWISPGWLCRLKVLLALLLLNFLAPDLLAQSPSIDGDPSEWPNVLNSVSNTKKGFARDKNGFNNTGLDDGFTQGTKPESLLEAWRWVYGQTNDKGDIENAGTALIKNGSNQNVLYFFGDRSSFNGTAKIGFWFLLDDVHLTGDGSTPGSPFSGKHQNGDIFVLNDFTSGGSAATPKIYMWLGKTSSSPGSLVGPLTNLPAGTALSITNGPPPTNGTTYPAPGGTSGTVINIPATGAPAGSTQLWRFTSKPTGQNQADGTYYPPLFFEGYINLTLLGTVQGVTVNPCFQSFIMQTTTSQNNVSANVDLVAGHFSGVPDKPKVTPDEQCKGFDATAKAECTGSTAQWYDAVTNQLVTTGDHLTLPAGTDVGTYNYNVTCKNEDGCESAPSAVSIKILENPTVLASVTVESGITKTNENLYVMKLSTTNVAHLVAVGSKGTPPYTYEWTALDANAAVSFSTDASPTDGSKATFKVLSTQGLNLDYSFRVKIKDSKGCVSTDDVTIEINKTAPPCGISGPAVVCAGATNVEYKYTPTPFPDADFNYIWSITSDNGSTLVGGSPQTNNTSASVFVNAGATAGSYTVALKLESKILGADGKPLIVVDDANCPVTTTVTLVTCTVKLDANVSCKGACDGKATVSPTGGTAPYSYKWDNGETTVQATKLCGSEAGLKHTVEVTDSHGCKTTCDVTVLEPPALICTVKLDANTDCFVNNGKATVTPTGGTAPYSYKWDDGETTAQATALSKGKHTVEVTDKNGCKTTCDVTIPENPCQHIFCTNTTCLNFIQSTQTLPNICYNTSNGTITPGVFYYWTNVTAPTSSFTITVSQTNPCSAPIFQLGNGNQFNLQTGSSCGNDASAVTYSQNATTGTVTVSVSGAQAGKVYILGLKYGAKSGATFTSSCTFTFDASTTAGHVDGSTGQITVKLNCSATCVNTTIATVAARAITPTEAVSDLQVHAYPNPFNSTINFNFVSPVSGKASLEVFDLLGRKLANVYQGNVDANKPQAIPYKVPSAHMVPMIYRLTVGDHSTRGTLLPGNKEP